ncbi:MAG: hypothetical protein AAFR28_14295 [Pseudomonadota bacterium]
MSILNVLTILRDVSTVFLMLAVAALAYLLLSGSAFSAGVLGSLLIATLSGVVALALHGLMTGLLGVSVTAALVLTLVIAVGVMLVGAQSYGARGLWFGLMSLVGVLGAWVFIWVFMRELSGPAALAGPAVAFVSAALLSVAALAASVRVAETRAEAIESRQIVGHAQREARLTAAVFGPPPSWFDCSYATLTGGRAESGKCASNPPPVEAVPAWAGASPDMRVAAALPRASTEPDTPAKGDIDIGQAPPPASDPDVPSIDIPDFAPLGRGREDVAPDEPQRLQDVTGEIETSSVGDPDGPDTQAAAPVLSGAPRPAPDLEADDQPDIPAPQRAAAPVTELSALKAPAETQGVTGDLARRGPERKRTEFVCFPMLGAVAEQLCPDERLEARDFEVSWLSPGGETIAASESVECFQDSNAALHLTIIVNLSGDLVGTIRRTDQATARVRKADALYDVVARIIGAARSSSRQDGDDGAEASAQRLLLSMNVINGSKLQSPWAARELGARKVDRLFDVRASGQTLSLLKRLKGETQGLRRETEAADLAVSLQETLATLPTPKADPSLPPSQPLFLLLTDADAAQRFDEGAGEEVGALLSQLGAPFFSVELGSATPSADLRRLADASDGAAFAVISNKSLAGIVDRVIARARSFCALRISAPESFFSEGALQVRLRREMIDGCQFEQIATMSCDGLSRRERIIE